MQRTTRRAHRAGGAGSARWSCAGRDLRRHRGDVHAVEPDDQPGGQDRVGGARVVLGVVGRADPDWGGEDQVPVQAVLGRPEWLLSRPPTSMPSVSSAGAWTGPGPAGLSSYWGPRTMRTWA